MYYYYIVNHFNGGVYSRHYKLSAALRRAAAMQRGYSRYNPGSSGGYSVVAASEYPDWDPGAGSFLNVDTDVEE
jgi:hypothetical protein